MKKLMMMAAVAGVLYTSLLHGAEPILLKSGTIQPGKNSAASATLTKTASRQSDKIADRGLYIIQHDGIITPDWRKQIEDAGAVIRGYIPENAYLIQADRASYATIADSVEHTYLGDYAPEYRYEAALVVKPQSKSTSSADKTSAADDETAEILSDCDILLFDAASREKVAARVASLLKCSVVSSDGKVIRAKLTVSAIQEIASWIEVCWIDRHVTPTLNNNVAVQAPRMNVESVWPNGGTGLGLTGKGQVVAVADTGLDTGNMSTLHDDVKGRVVKAYALGRSNDWSDLNGHGTHVVGSVLGNGVKSNGSIKGGAYEATLVFQSTQDKDGYLTGIPNDLNTLFGQAYDAGARIHSNSWGSGRQDGSAEGAWLLGNYRADSRAIDEFMFNHPDMLILFAAGNDGVDWFSEDGVIDSDSIGSEPTAKNCITVGASENYRTSGGYSSDSWAPWPKFDKETFPKDPIASDYISRPSDNSNQGMAAFSSRGPCDDGRIKPDIVAPGTDILSLSSSVGPYDTWGPYNAYYRYMGGTSMACPLVAGSAALVRQWLVENRKITNPDGATIKAVLLAGAKSLTPGQYGTGQYREIPASYPNNVEGWGQVNLGNSVQNAKGLLIYDAQVITANETQTFKVKATAGNQLNIVMAYTDAPASLSATKQLVNDLDLLVTAPSGTTYYPNSRTSADRINNVEGVRIPSVSVESGTYTITVKGYNITQGMATTLTGGKSNAQRYSLVVNGADVVTTYTVTFNANGGTVSPTARTVNGGSVVGDLPMPTRSNYTFDGWYTASSGGTRVYSTTVVTGNITYYAHWTPVVAYYTVTFNANGGTVSPSTRQVASGTAVGALPTPSRSNYTFDGWYTAASGGAQIMASTVVTASVTYFAHWTAIPVNYTVTFNPNGGTVSPSSRMIASGSAVGTLPTPTRSGYMFAGWWTSLVGGTKVDSGTIVIGNATYYAHWTTSPFLFGGDAQWSLQGDGSYKSGVIGDNGTSWMEATVTGDGTVSFKWRVSSEANCDTLTFAIDGVTKASISGTNTAAWTSMSCAVSGSGTHTLRWTYTKDLSLSYGNDCGWVTDYQWTGSSAHTVTFNPNGGTVSETTRSVAYNAVIGQLPAATRSGYTFNGWWTAASGGTQITPTTIVSANITCYAHWVSASFTLGGNANWAQQTDGSWKSGTITDSQSTWMETTVSGEGTVSFKWKVSSEYYCDKLSFYVDGQQRDAISGTVDWSQKYVIVTGSGTHTLRWTYSKDGSVSRGDDCGWIKDYQYSDSIEPSMLSDLYPYTPTGWSGPLALSASSQSATNSTATSFSPNDSIFASFAVANSGAAFENDFRWALYVDESLRATGANWGQGLSSNGSSRWTAIAIGPLSVGTHTVKVVYDYTGLVAESNEGNNIVTKTVTVSGTVMRPSNDDFANATVISGAVGSTAGSNINATYQPGEPLTAVRASATNTIWWTWTAPASGSVQFNTIASEVYDTVMGIYTGTSVSALTRVASNDDCRESGGYSQSSNSFTVVSGTKYHIAVSGSSYRYQGGIQLNWSMPVSQTYIVVYSPGAYASGVQETATKTNGVALMLRGAIFTRTGYTQTGWSTNSNGSTRDYALNDSYTVNSAITLYPYWTANSYVLSISPNGGTLVGSNFGAAEGTSQQTSVNVTYGALYYYELGTATRSGYVFDGWWTSATGGERVYNADGMAVTGSSYWNKSWQWQYPSNLTIYAHWISAGNTVTLDANGGSVSGQPSVSFPVENGKYTSQAGANRTVSRSGYTLVGWYDTSASSGGNMVFDARGYAVNGKYWDGAYSPNVSSAKWKFAGNVTAYARWVKTPPYRVVTFDANGGVIGDAGYTAIVVEQGKYTMQAGASGTKATRSGYTLVGWYDTSASSGGNMVFDARGYAVNGKYWDGAYSPKVSSAKWKYAGNVVAYARWVKTPPYRVVTFDANGGVIGNAAYAAVAVEIGKNTNQAGASGTKAARAGYSLVGWFDTTNSAGGNIVFDARGYAVNGKYWEGAYSPKASSAKWRHAGSVTAYARWVKSPPFRVVTLDANGGAISNAAYAAVVVEDGKATMQAGASGTKAARAGYSLVGWFDTTNSAGGNIVFDAHGYAVNGKYWDGAYDPGKTAAKWKFSGNVTAYARWIAQGQLGKYTATLNANGGSIGGQPFLSAQTEYGKYTNQAAANRAVTREGYSLVGWFDADGNMVFDARGYAVNGKYWDGAYSPKVSSAKWKYAGNVVAYARWVKTPPYRVVTFDANGEGGACVLYARGMV